MTTTTAARHMEIGMTRVYVVREAGQDKPVRVTTDWDEAADAADVPENRRRGVARLGVVKPTGSTGPASALGSAEQRARGAMNRLESDDARQAARRDACAALAALYAKDAGPYVDDAVVQVLGSREDTLHYRAVLGLALYLNVASRCADLI